ncbi:MAG: hypothetical protein JO309_17040 [Pseudonocardiales bacterium]|nr:hypothetical protein [Pseudonocardiales bacterium]MBV9731077.1 hypothetical protein [Pseudonocardiales bacterium]
MTTRSTGVSLVQAATRLAAHLADHTPPEPTSLTVETRNAHSELTAQLRSTTLPTVAGDLLAWAETLTMVTAQAWRVPQGDRVHLSLAGTLTDPAPAIELDVFGGVNHDPEDFVDLEPGEHRVILLAQLRTWAASAPTTTSSPALERRGAN